MLPAAPRLPDARRLIGRSQYFVVHAPRQTGKTTTLAVLARELTAEGGHVALRFSCERAAVTADDYGTAELQVLTAIGEAAAGAGLAGDLLPPSPWPEASPGSRLRAALTAWASRCPLPIVLLFDEIDALAGQSLRSVLSQLRDGYTARPEPFPASVVLCGLRDVRDYKAASGGDPSRLGSASPFNIAAESLRIGDFSRDETAELYKQHTAETGQEFTQEAVDRAFGYSQGQPWLVNALAREVIDKMGVEPTAPVTGEHVETAKERLILARATHLDSLVRKLNEPRVRRVIEPLITGTLPEADNVYDDDVSYVQDLGLIAQGNPVRVANPVYREVIVRVLGAGIERVITASPQRFLLSDGRLNFRMLLEAFAAFWVENGEVLTSSTVYPEAAPQLVFMAFLQRIVNGGARDGKQSIDREYGVGRGRVDLLVRKPYGDGLVQREAAELKMRNLGRPDPLADGLSQLDRYLDRLGLETGTLVIFDRRPEADEISKRTALMPETTASGRTVTLLRA
jgi:hypothetical protein